MALKIELKPGERIILGQSVITNGDHRATIIVEGDEPLLREKDILRPEEATSPARRIYLAIQLMYLARGGHADTALFNDLAGDLALAAPSTRPHLERINNHILTHAYYKALREARRLIDYEGELLKNAQSC